MHASSSRIDDDGKRACCGTCSDDLRPRGMAFLARHAANGNEFRIRRHVRPFGDPGSRRSASQNATRGPESYVKANAMLFRRPPGVHADDSDAAGD